VDENQRADYQGTGTCKDDSDEYDDWERRERDLLAMVQEIENNVSRVERNFITLRSSKSVLIIERELAWIDEREAASVVGTS